MAITHLIQERWQTLSERFSALQQREKILVSVSVLLILYLIWELVFVAPMDKQQAALVARFENANRELEVLNAQQKVMVKALSNDPDAAKRREVMRLEQQLAQADKKLQAMSVGLLPAEQLPQVLHDVLRESGRLQLEGMQSLAPAKLELAKPQQAVINQRETDKAVAAARGQADEAVPEDSQRLAEERIIGVYKHAVRLSLQGSYFSVIAYLQQLEKLPWRFYWDFIDYQVADYPNAKITLAVYTLSTEKGVLGE